MEFIELLGLIISAIALLLTGTWALFKFIDRKRDSRTIVDRQVSLKITELNVKVLNIEKEVGEMKNRHACDFASLRNDLMSSLTEFKKDNKETNHEILKKLETQNEILIKLCVNYENHVENHQRKARV